MKALRSGQSSPPCAQTPQSPCSCPAKTPKDSASFFLICYDLHSLAFFTRFSKNIGTHRGLVKETSLTNSNLPRRLGEACYNTPRHLLQRCSSRPLWKSQKALTTFRKTTSFDLTRSFSRPLKNVYNQRKSGIGAESLQKSQTRTAGESHQTLKLTML